MVENSTLSEIIRRNTNITHVPRHVFYSTLYCMDVKNEQCIPCIDSSSSEKTSAHECTTTELKSRVENLTQTVQELQQKSNIQERKLTLNEKEKRNLDTQLENVRKQNRECNMHNATDENLTLTNSIRTLKEENQMLKNNLENLKSADGSAIDNTTVVCLIVFMCVFLIITATSCVLYLKKKIKCKKSSYFQRHQMGRNPTKSTSF